MSLSPISSAHIYVDTQALQMIQNAELHVHCTESHARSTPMKPLHTLSLLAAIACNESGLKVVNSDPVALISNPADGDELLEGFDTLLLGRVSDVDHSFGELEVRWYLGDDERICKESTPDEIGDVFCTVKLGIDASSVRLEVIDTLGGQDSDTVNFGMIPTDSPRVTIIRPEGEWGYYIDQLLTFEGMVSDGEDAPKNLVAQWESSIDGLLLDVESSPNAAGDVLGFGTLSQGVHAITLTVTDTSGKQATDSVIVTIGPANTAPTCAITAPDNGSSGPASETVSLEAQVEDVDVPSDWLTLSWTSDIDGEIGSSTPSTSGESTLLTDALSGGSHTLTMRVTDEQGASCSDNIVYAVQSPPSVLITAPADGVLIQEGELLSFAAEVSDAEDGPEALSIQWTSSVDGVLDSSSADASGIAGFATATLGPGTHTVTLTVTDADAMSADDEITLTVNGLPVVSDVTISYTDPQVWTATALSCAATATDPEGESLSIAYTWTNSTAGTTLDAGTDETTVTLRPETASPEDTIVCTATSTDTAGGTDSGSDSVLVVNSTPTAPTVSISPEEPSPLDDLVCSVDTAASDPDGDALSYSFVWTVDGTSSGRSLTGAAAADTLTVPASATSADEVWTCTITANDGTADSPAGWASVTLANEPPTAPEVSISTAWPSSSSGPDTLDPLECRIDTAATDPDGDALTYDFVWTRDGGSTGHSLSSASVSATLTAPASDTAAGEVWTCTVTANDGTTDGPAGTASVTIENSPPTAPTALISPAAPTSFDDISCSIDVEATDADGDALLYDVVWTVDGASTSHATYSSGAGTTRLVRASETAADEVWTCTITANDGTTDGPAGTASVTILTPYIDCGDGEMGLPIASCADLEAMQEDVTETYCLTNDVDCSVIEDFDAVGESAGSIYFTGRLLGNGYTISDFSTTDPGIFWYFSGEVHDLTMTNVYLNPRYSRSGAIAGTFHDPGIIVNVSVSGTVDALSEDTDYPDRTVQIIGGLVGSMSATADSGIFDSSFDGTIDGGDKIGGLVGLITGGELSGCTVTATINAEESAGGLIGLQSVASAPRDFITISDSEFSGDVSGGEAVGGITASLSNGTMEGCFSEGSVTSTGHFVGGLVGDTSAATIRQSSSTSSVAGDRYVGGLSGRLTSHTGEAVIEESFATGNVIGTDYTGGLLGHFKNAFVTDSYATGDVVGTDRVGGLIGYASSCTGAVVQASYSAGSVTGTGVSVGGMVGFTQLLGCAVTTSYDGAYWDTDSSGWDTSDGGEGRTTTEMTTEATFVDWDFTDTWTIAEGSSYPCLQWQGEDCHVPE
jgi:hypothetical protein